MTINSASEIIYRCSSTADQKLFIFHDRREEILPYLQAVDEIQRTIDFADSSEDERKEAKAVIQIAGSRLTEEFCNILKVHTEVNSSLNPNSHTDSTTLTDSTSNKYEVHEDDYVNRNTLSTDAIDDLRSIAVRMNSSGFIHECSKAYVSKRRSVIGASFQQLNVEKLSRKTCRRLEWGDLEPKIQYLIRAAKVCFKYYFVNEKRLCEQIFHNLGDETTDSCFMESITDHTIQLFDIAEAISSIPTGSERLFRILDLHDTLSDLLPLIDNLFNSQSSNYLRTKVTKQIIPKLADKANEILLYFENSLVNEQSPPRTEPIHQLSKYVMHHVYKLCNYKQSLMRLSLPNFPSMDAAGTGSVSTSFSLHVDWIIMSLVSNLEVKSKLCKDLPATRFFAMNNFHYIIQKIKACPELLEVVTDNSLNKLVDKFEQARSEYLNLTLDVVLSKIKISSFRVSKLADRLKRFNDEFEKLGKDLGKEVVADFGLMLELRKLIGEMVVNAYSSFLVHTKKVGRLEAYVKYSAEGIESAIQEFFDCNTDR